MRTNRFNRLLSLGAVLAALMAPALPSQAAALADKLELLGVPDHIKVDTIRLMRRNDLLNVQVELHNDSGRNQMLYYRFKWLDEAGFTVGGEEPWKPLTLYGVQKKEIQTVAPASQASDFRLELQSPENTVKSSN